MPQDDVTPRSDSLSTTSTASPPDQQNQNNQSNVYENGENRDQHRKSTSLDDININNDIMRNGAMHLTNSNQIQNNPQAYKSFSLQRPLGQQVSAPVVPLNPSANPTSTAPIYASTTGMLTGGVQIINPDGTVTIRRQAAARAAVPPAAEEEDPYGRCMNMKLTSFSESQLQQQKQGIANHPQPVVGSRDPRIIDLNSTASSSTASISSTPPNTTMNAQMSQPYEHHNSNPTNFNTLPAQMNGVNGVSDITNPTIGGGGVNANPHNTLPARVNGISVNGSTSAPGNKLFNGPSGRHFKPFDHRRMNPMADIQEDPSYGVVGNPPHPVPSSSPFVGRTNQINNGPNNIPNNSLIVSHVNSNMPHMPAELRHTNYSGAGGIPFSGNNVSHQRQQQLVNQQGNETMLQNDSIGSFFFWFNVSLFS